MTCVHCHKDDHPEEIVQVGEHFAHIDCAYEYHLEHLVDPTARYINETDAAYAERMRSIGVC